MRRTRVVLAGAVAAAVVLAGQGCGDGDASARSGTLREEFKGGRLDHSVWNTCHWWSEHGCTIGSNDELEWYLPSQVRVHRGVLRLVAERKTVYGGDGTPYPYASGMVSTGPPHGSREPKFAFRYGRAEIRARLPSGRGLWPAFWLLPASRVSKPEIDVMEKLGHEPDTVSMHLHWRDGNGESQQRGKYWSHPGLSDGWHRFAVDWRPGRITWLVDGVERWTVRGDTVPDVPMYLVVNLAVGGWAGTPSRATRFPAAVSVDWVRVTR